MVVRKADKNDYSYIYRFLSDKMALSYARKFLFPYGWIKESGTPPEPHCNKAL